MTDYQCPSCSGGFPAAAATDDECPWCGEPIDGSDSDSSGVEFTPGVNRFEPFPDPPTRQGQRELPTVPDNDTTVGDPILGRDQL